MAAMKTSHPDRLTAVVLIERPRGAAKRLLPRWIFLPRSRAYLLLGLPLVFAGLSN